MKKLFTTVTALLVIIQYSQAQWTSGTGTVTTTNSTDKVGIGSATPGERFVVLGSTGSAFSATAKPIALFAQDVTNSRGIYLGFDSANQTGVISSSTSGAASNIAFWNFTGSYWAEHMRLTSAGNLGIGTSNPGVKLDVQGDIGKYDAYQARFQGLRIGTANVYGSSGAMTLSLVNKVSAARDGVGGNAEKYLIKSDGFDTYIAEGAGNLIYSGTGVVGIGTTIPDAAYKLSVNGKIRSKEIKVETGWSDYVFNDNYKLKTIPEVENFIKNNHHLPEVPSAAEVEKNGVNLGETSSLLLKKIEELTLYLIEKDKQLRKQSKQLNEQNIQLKRQRQDITLLKQYIKK